MRNPHETRKLVLGVVLVVDALIIGAGVWFFLIHPHRAAPAASVPAPPAPAEPGPALAELPQNVPSADRVEPAPPPPPANTASQPGNASTPPGPAPGTAEIDAARKLIDSGKLLEARQELDMLFKQSAGGPEDETIRGLLARVADQTVFSRKIVAGDPLMDTHEVQRGETLVSIAREHDLPWEALAFINGVDAARLRVGQKLKIPKSQFHVKIYKSKYRLDLYLGAVFLRSYRVGLGANDGTPEGIWKVRDRLQNPTYYPSASAEDKTIREGGDPNNPLGKYWIALEGLEGSAVGQQGYGIHGTIDPNSIGKNVSLGCIRMLNDDVEVVYKLVTPERSRVTVLP